MLDDRSCVACLAHDYAFDAARAWAAYRTELRRAILSLKRRQNRALGKRLASYLSELYRSQGWKVDLIVPIPLAANRQSQRGYNQVDLLARPLAATLGMPYVQGALVRSHETKPQFELNAAQRWENLHSAFQADPTPLQGVAVLLVDDIMTTGATLDAAAEALKGAGARQVFALALTRALFEAHGRIW
jgi:ComF family protein